MRYFSSFDQLLYRFGNEESQTAFQDLSAYSDVVDELKVNVISYNTYVINE